MSGGASQQRRREEARAAARALGIETSTVLKNRGGQLLPTLEARRDLVRIIREGSRRPHDFASKHRLPPGPPLHSHAHTGGGLYGNSSFFSLSRTGKSHIFHLHITGVSHKDYSGHECSPEPRRERELPNCWSCGLTGISPMSVGPCRLIIPISQLPETHGIPKTGFPRLPFATCGLFLRRDRTASKQVPNSDVSPTGERRILPVTRFLHGGWRSRSPSKAMVNFAI
jgi:hypothetical protein